MAGATTHPPSPKLGSRSPGAASVRLAERAHAAQAITSPRNRCDTTPCTSEILLRYDSVLHRSGGRDLGEGRGSARRGGRRGESGVPELLPAPASLAQAHF